MSAPLHTLETTGFGLGRGLLRLDIDGCVGQVAHQGSRTANPSPTAWPVAALGTWLTRSRPAIVSMSAPSRPVRHSLRFRPPEHVASDVVIVRDHRGLEADDRIRTARVAPADLDRNRDGTRAV